jgi:rhodanese-related sulfurtransferase
MKTKLSLLVFIFSLAGCQFQRPEYLKPITAAELHKTMQSGDIFLVDVHTPEQRHIKGTDLFIPYNEIETNQNRFPSDKNTAIYLYCKSGPMGNAAADSLYKFGYRNVFNLDGGLDAWRKSGFDAGQ